MKKYFFLLFLSFSVFTIPHHVQGQDYLVDHTYLGSRTKLQLLPVLLIVVEYDIDLYKIRYKTLDVNMQPDTASGLLVLPQVPASTKLPMVLYAHGTTSGPADVPSNLDGGYEIAMGYAGFGYATVAPDYLGLGDSHGFHPYLHAPTESSASRDMILAAREFLDQNDPDLNTELLFLAGYSQGGHTSMALHHELEQTQSLPVTAATHMSGPYSISGVMRERILSNDPYNFPSYIAYIFLSYHEAYGLYNDLGEVFKDPFATSIQRFYDGVVDLNQLNGELLTQLNLTGGAIVKRMLQDSIVDALQNDLAHPLNVALRANDTYNWSPEAPTRLYYCGMDTQVPYYNALLADSVMNALGADDVQAVNINNTYDHGACVFPSVLASKNFFDTFVDALDVNEAAAKNDFRVFPNPSGNEIIIHWEHAGENILYQLIDNSGKVVAQGETSSKKVDTSSLIPGVYTVKCTSGTNTKTARIIHQ